LEQHPELKGIDGAEVNEENWQECLATYVEQVGDLLEVLPITDGDAHKIIDPVQEVIDVIGEDRTTILVPDYPT